MTTMQEWVNQFLYRHDNNPRHRRINSGCNDPRRRTANKSDNILLYCTPCGIVWNWYSSSRGRKWIGYPKGNIPSINKKRVDCPNCYGSKK